MKRLLSNIILFLLLVVSPVSFSTSSIPNFYILVTINAPLQESKKSSIIVAHRVGKSTTPVAVVYPEVSIPLHAEQIQFDDTSIIIEHGRAPPVVLPV